MVLARLEVMVRLKVVQVFRPALVVCLAECQPSVAPIAAEPLALLLWECPARSPYSSVLTYRERRELLVGLTVILLKVLRTSSLAVSQQHSPEHPEQRDRGKSTGHLWRDRGVSS